MKVARAVFGGYEIYESLRRRGFGRRREQNQAFGVSKNEACGKL